MMPQPAAQTLDPALPARVVFMGTPSFAVPTLRALIVARTASEVWPAGVHVVGALTRPDKPTGRGRHVVYSPVKQAATGNGVDIFQPGSLRRPEALDMLASLAPDVIVVAAFGQILPASVLDLPRRGCLNVHASLLPRWRGASPIAAAIRAGDAETGVTIMAMDEGLDTGDIISSRSLRITETDTTGLLTERLADLGARLLIETLHAWLAGTATRTPQDDQTASLTRPLRKEDGRFDWSQSAETLARQARAMAPWPGAYTTWKGSQIKLLDITVAPAGKPLPAGSCYVAPDGSLTCACGEGALSLRVIQLEGKRAMPSADVLRGRPALASAILG